LETGGEEVAVHTKPYTKKINRDGSPRKKTSALGMC
jgi:hypothetical protein